LQQTLRQTANYYNSISKTALKDIKKHQIITRVRKNTAYI